MSPWKPDLHCYWNPHLPTFDGKINRPSNHQKQSTTISLDIIHNIYLYLYYIYIILLYIIYYYIYFDIYVIIFYIIYIYIIYNIICISICHYMIHKYPDKTSWFWYVLGHPSGSGLRGPGPGLHRFGRQHLLALPGGSATGEGNMWVWINTYTYHF